jgi:glycosyltransferase involved in cell wall biosynthesis
MGESHLVSVIIPTYKTPEALDLCIQSAVEGQLYDNQIIVVVDGTQTENQQVLDKWKNHIDPIIFEENQGLCRATNIGVYNAKHDKILVVNDDNVFPRHWDGNLHNEWVMLAEQYGHENIVLTPNQIEPYPSMFTQFVIEDLGRSIAEFDLDKFWLFDYHYASGDKREESGSTLPFMMRKIDYLRVGGWDENFQFGMVADWDFLLKCQLSGMRMVRTWICHFYHFVSLTTKTPETQAKRAETEQWGHQYAALKWGTNIKHNPKNNLKYL